MSVPLLVRVGCPFLSDFDELFGGFRCTSLLSLVEVCVGRGRCPLLTDIDENFGVEVGYPFLTDIDEAYGVEVGCPFLTDVDDDYGVVRRANVTSLAGWYV